MAQVKKISVATVYGKIDLKTLIEKSSMPIMTVIGLAIGTRVGQSAYGDWTALVGQFQAANAETGEVMDAAQLFLPDVALLPIQTALARPECKGVEFAIQVSVHYAADAKPGGSPYEYSFEPLLPPDENDPISRMKVRLATAREAAATALIQLARAADPAHADPADPAASAGKGKK